MSSLSIQQKNSMWSHGSQPLYRSYFYHRHSLNWSSGSYPGWFEVTITATKTSYIKCDIHKSVLDDKAHSISRLVDRNIDTVILHGVFQTDSDFRPCFHIQSSWSCWNVFWDSEIKCAKILISAGFFWSAFINLTHLVHSNPPAGEDSVDALSEADPM
jgi:hypothetical protein